jgi:hypothetical protein
MAPWPETRDLVVVETRDPQSGRGQRPIVRFENDGEPFKVGHFVYYLHLLNRPFLHGSNNICLALKELFAPLEPHGTTTKTKAA